MTTTFWVVVESAFIDVSEQRFASIFRWNSNPASKQSLFFDLADGGSTFLRNMGKLLLD
jgi:hypothetical protein